MEGHPPLVLRRWSARIEHTCSRPKKLHGPVPYKITGPHDVPISLLTDGPFTNRGPMGMEGLEGVVGLDLFWHLKRITGDGFAPLAGMANFGSLE